MSRFTSGRIAACLGAITLTAAAVTILGKAAIGAGGAGGLGFRAPGDVFPAVTSLGTIAPATIITGAGYGTGGVGLRNRAGGSIGISGVIPPTKKAVLYWGVITSGPPTAANASVIVQRLLPTPASPAVLVKGAPIGTGASPCWAGDRITIFRGLLTTAVATGNGEYQIDLQKGASGTTSGADPWTGQVLPLMDGASLVIVGSGAATVAIDDKGLAGNTFAGNPGLAYTLKLPIAASGRTALFDNIGADGQHGASRTDVLGASNERTIVNGIAIAGPGSNANDSDWNGSSALPLPQLWDDTGHDITTAAPAGTTALKFSIANGGQANYDCLTPVANVVSLL